MLIDLHTHSAVSDGTDTPAELVTKSAARGLDVVALTDHDTYAGLDAAAATATESGVQLVRGMELSCDLLGRSVHLLAYGADEQDAALAAEIGRVQQGRSNRLLPVLAKLAELDVPVTEAEVLAKVGDSPSVGRPHIADALVAAGHVRDRQEAFDRFLGDRGPAHVHRYAISLEHGIDLVHGAGGVAVIAHPWGRGRADLLPASRLAALVAEHGLDGIEVDHQDHDADTRGRLRAVGERLGVIMTGSSDYHGAGKVDHDLGCNTTDPQMYAELIARVRA
ncbi:MAG: PHP domain-containing protein [Propionibacteriaceae bacterium]